MKYLILLTLFISGCCNCPSSICEDRGGVDKIQGESWIYCNDGSSYDRYLEKFR